MVRFMQPKAIAIYIYRMMRTLKIPYILLAFLISISLHSLRSYTTHHGDNKQKILGSLQQVIAPQPHVKELGVGVQEEENSANEVFDGDSNSKEASLVRKEDNAANEVNSMEPGGVSETDHSRKRLSPHINNWRNFSQAHIERLSVLGRRLYLAEDIGTVQDKNFTILFWKTGRSAHPRFMQGYLGVDKDPFQSCSVRNCRISYDESDLDTADAVLIHLHRTKGVLDFPSRPNYDQRWIWLTDESPYFTFMVAKDKNISHYNGYFNWSMCYRSDCDVPAPYGRTVEMTESQKASYQSFDYFKNNTKLVAIMGSNCGGTNRRWNYVRELQKHMVVDTYGGCGTLKCPGHFRRDCPLIDDYKFYLSFENANCDEYITEKVWWNAINKGAIPVVMGGPVENYRKLLPPGSFIHIDNFKSPKHLAEYIQSVAADKEKYMAYHAWRSKYVVLNEHGYLGSPVFHYCRLCEAMNYNDPAPKVYNNLEKFWNSQIHCYKPTWQERMEET